MDIRTHLLRAFGMPGRHARCRQSVLALCGLGLSACGTLLGLDEHHVAPATDTLGLGECATPGAPGCDADEDPAETLPAAACASPPCSDAVAPLPSPGNMPGEQTLAGDAPLAAPMEVAPLGDGMACLSESRGTELRPLALYMMLDSSGSMEETAGGLRTKWDSVRRAIRGFLAETRDTDLLLGMQFFPLLKPGVSSFVCTTHADCGDEGGPCFLSTCRNGTTIQLCRTDDDCPGGPEVNPCVDFGLCSMSDPNAPLACILGQGGSCGDGQGACEDFERTCTNATSCDPALYGAPAVEIAPVAQAIVAIDQALTGRLPEGLTPTVPALQGTVDHARAWALAHPEHSVAALLVTDGLPTECGVQQQTGGTETINQVLSIAAQGISSATPVRTFVIGVFQPGEQVSINNTSAIAQAGGTEAAAFIDSSGEVEQQFLQALRTVKDAAAPCRLPLERVEGLDFQRIDVQVDAGDGAVMSLPYVAGLVGCAGTPAGWYYYTPSDGAPRALELCPGICQVLKSTPSSGLQIEVGCAE